jgi:hypothetical protein
MKKEYHVIYTLDKLKKNISVLHFTARNDKKAIAKVEEWKNFYKTQCHEFTIIKLYRNLYLHNFENPVEIVIRY